jgi:hypothetical protein
LRPDFPFTDFFALAPFRTSVLAADSSFGTLAETLKRKPKFRGFECRPEGTIQLLLLTHYLFRGCFNEDMLHYFGYSSGRKENKATSMYVCIEKYVDVLITTFGNFPHFSEKWRFFLKKKKNNIFVD